jgi:hypothetical protein
MYFGNINRRSAFANIIDVPKTANQVLNFELDCHGPSSSIALPRIENHRVSAIFNPRNIPRESLKGSPKVGVPYANSCTFDPHLVKFFDAAGFWHSDDPVKVFGTIWGIVTLKMATQISTKVGKCLRINEAVTVGA